MENLLMNFNFDNPRVNSTVGNFSALFKNVTITEGPNKSQQSSKALNLGDNGMGEVNLTGFNPNFKKFCLQISFSINHPVISRQNIMESNFLPFALFADKASSNDSYHLISSVQVKNFGWRQVDTLFKKELKLKTWYSASIVYDHDTLGLFIDEELISVHGFSDGTIKPNDAKKLFFGSWVDGSRFHLKGSLHFFKWFDGIPNQLESLLDEQRTSAEWHITFKHAELHGKLNTGDRLKDIQYNSSVGSFMQLYQHCGIMYHESMGQAFELHGSIYSKYQTLRNNAAELGFLVSDESIATDNQGRKSLFSKGGIYWSNNTGAVTVLNEIYLEYENLGESKVLGFPLEGATNIPGGKEQLFQRARMYYKNGTGKAQEVHGAILSKYLALGGVKTWGFPITNESDVRKGSSVIGKFSEFEGCTIYWKSGLGAFEVHGDIRKRYNDIKGPLGDLGFPTSDETNIPNFSGPGRINSFEKGCIAWYGSENSIRVVLPFKIRVQRIHSRENEGIAMGENDIHFYAHIKEGANVLYSQRHPSNGDFGDHNIINPNLSFPIVITPNKIDMRISFSIDIRDSDPGRDDHLGNHTTILSASNAWGFNQPNLVFNQSFSKIISLLWSIQPQINISNLTPKEKWWNFDNFKTPTITENQYASAFRDVDSEAEWWDIDDHLKNLFYSWVVKGIAKGGNCFGMSLEAIYALKNNSLFNQPLVEVVEDNNAINEINIKQEYQMGAHPMWWFVGQFLTGNTHDPKDVFLATRNAHRRGDNPVICISQNYNFSGSPHCIMPYHWVEQGNIWKILVMDPSTYPDVEKEIIIKPTENTFEYSGENRYSGGEWTGGRIHYMPFCVLNSMQRTPVWDAIMLILSGTILILADDAETVSIKDENGNDLDGNGERAKNILKSGSKPEGFFTSYVGFNTATIKPGQFMMRIDKIGSNISNIQERVSVKTISVKELTKDKKITNFTSRTLAADNAIIKRINNRSAHFILNDPALSGQLSANLKNNLANLLKINSSRNFEHTIKGVKNGKLEYLIKSELNTIKISSSMDKDEINTIMTKDLKTIASNIDFKASKAKKINIEVVNKLGVKGDYLKLSINNITVNANKSVMFNVKAGFAGLEVENLGISENLPISVSGVIDNKRIDKKFNVPFDQAVRIKPSTILNSDDLIISRISKMFGRIEETQNLRKI